jgi:hypothetical protein
MLGASSAVSFSKARMSSTITAVSPGVEFEIYPFEI